MMGKSRDGRTAYRRRQIEQLSAYIDGELSAAERARLEARLAGDASLRTELAELRKTVALMRELPSVAVPRNFMLPQSAAKPAAAVGVSRPRWGRAAPVLTAATSVVSGLFVFALAGSLLTSPALRSMDVPTREIQALEAPAAAVEEVAAEVEAEVAATVIAEAPEAEEPVEMEAPPPAEEEVPDQALSEESGESIRDAIREEADEAKSPPLELEMEAEGTEMPFRETLSAENASGMAEAPMAEAPTSDAGGGGGAEPPPAPSPTAEPAPTATVVHDAPGEGMAAEREEASVEDEVAPTSAAEAPSGGPIEEGAVQKAEPKPTTVWGAAASVSAIPWRALQIGLGSAAALLLVATLWAWRMRR